MKTKSYDKLKKGKFGIVIIIGIVFMALAFVFATISLISAFTSDSLRIASDASSILQSILNDEEQKVVDTTQNLADLSQDYVKGAGVDAYDELFNSFESVEGYDKFATVLIRDESDYHISSHESGSGNKIYEIIDEDFVELVASQKRSVCYVRRSSNNVSKNFNLYTYYPVEQKTDELGEKYGVSCVITVTPVDNIYNTEQVIANLEKYKADIYLLDINDSGKNYLQITKDGFIKGTSSLSLILKEGYGEDFANEVLSVTDRSKIKNNGETFVITRETLGHALSKTDILAIYNETELQTAESPYFMRALTSICIALACAFIVAVFVSLKIKNLKQITQKEEEKDLFLDCSTTTKFKRDAENIILDNRSQSFALVGITFANINYLKEHYGEDMEMDVKKYMANVMSSVLQKNEAFCFVTGAQFVLLLRYENKAEIPSKITLIVELINRYSAFEKLNFVGLFNNGIYYVQPSDKVDIEEFMSRVQIAMLSHKKDPAKKFAVYDRQAYEDYQIQAEIEAKMDTALKNGNFHLMFQPKYSIKKDCLEGAETLVRWYDPERKGYIPPNRFIHLFELNGFINKLDRYIFTSVCEFFANAMRHGLKVTTINVNVSRVTATQKDFIEFYAQTKRKCGIPDGYITIEFTESFSFTDMTVLRNIAIQLRKNGFKCAIDDFGAGYSSIGILKELPIDELKLDMFLLNPTDNPKNDKALIDLIVKIGKAFDMKVTQEGVETLEQLEMLKEMGCDLIQGFYYAKPMFADDFQNFVSHPNDLQSVKENRSHINYRRIKYVDFFTENK